ncbi:MAG: VTT domain-containing protein [Acholeplasma sp.]|nr:VTT domain-containing protein [Acholeplasma sp.]
MHLSLMNFMQLILSTDVQKWYQPILDFFGKFGDIGLFLYSIIETITPLAGVEFFIIPMIMGSPSKWLLITFLIVIANSVGAIIVYLFIAKEDNWFYNKFISPKNQNKAKKMFKRYGFWAIFIFAMTPLPFFVILFTVALGGMKFWPYLISTALSRGIRFFMTTFFIHKAVIAGESVNTGTIIFWLTLVGVLVTVFFVIIQQLLLKFFEHKIEHDA